MSDEVRCAEYQITLLRFFHTFIFFYPMALTCTRGTIVNFIITDTHFILFCVFHLL